MKSIAVCIVFMIAVLQITPAQTNPFNITEVETESLENVYQYTERVYSGSVPAEEEDFKQLSEFGIQTILSVDGARPNLELANQYGMRYVHVPVRYSGIEDQESQIIAKAIRDLSAPIYVHCHHGKHRGPTAAALGLVLLGEWDNQTAIKAMVETGTGRQYVGLYRNVDGAAKLDDAFFDQLDAAFPEEVPVPPMVEEMVEIQKVYDQLKHIQTNNWRVRPGQNETRPDYLALQLRELAYEFRRSGAGKDKNTQFRSMVTAIETAAESLEKELREWQPNTLDEEAPKKFDGYMNRITRSCTSCHILYRNSPNAASMD